MPYSSDSQRKYFNFKAKSDPKFKKLADEYNKKSKGMKLPSHVGKKCSTCGHVLGAGDAEGTSGSVGFGNGAV